jgi:hypothetical protein
MRIRLAGHAAHMGEMRNTCKVLLGKPEEKMLLGTHRHRWNDNIKIDLREICVGIWTGFICAGWGPLAACYERGNKTSDSIQRGEFIDS